MIDADSEALITLQQARSEFPNRPSLPTVWRWLLKGLYGVRLDSLKIGGRRYTSVEAIARFMEATAKADRLAAKPKQSKKNKQNQSLAHAKLALDQFGI